MARVNDILNTEAPDIEPLSPLEKIAIDCPHIETILHNEERRVEEHFRTYDAFRESQHALRVEIGEVKADRFRNDTNAKPSAKLEERLVAKQQALEAKLRTNDFEYEVMKANRPGSASQSLRENFILTPAVHLKYVPANTTDTLAVGKTVRDMCDDYRAKRAAKVTEKTAAIKAPVPEGDVRLSIGKAVQRSASRALIAELSTIRRPDFNEKTGRFSLRMFEMPTTPIVGATMISNYGDGLGVLAALFPEELTDRLTAIALANHDPAKAIGLAERADMVAVIDAEILAIDYKLELWFRRAFADGINPGPRVSAGSPLAVLDIKRA